MKTKLLLPVFFALVVLIVFSSVEAMKKLVHKTGYIDPGDTNTYQGKSVTPDNLYNIGPQEISDDVKEKIRNYYIKHIKIYKGLVQQPGPRGGRTNLMAKYIKAVAALARMGRMSLNSGLNFAFKSPCADGYIEKISGPSNRLHLRAYEQGIRYENFLDYDPKKDKLKATYQTASRKFHHLRIREAIEKFKLDSIERPPSAIVCVNPDKKESCADQDCVFVEKKLTGYKTLGSYRKEKRLDEILDKKRLVQLIIATKYAGIFNHSYDNILVNPETKKLVIADTEQPNTTKSNQLFDTDIKRYKHNIKEAMNYLYKMLPKGSPQREWVEEFCRNDKNIIKSYSYCDSDDSDSESDPSDDTYFDSKTFTEIEEINQKLSDVFNTMRTRLEIIDSRRLKQMDSCTKKYYKKYEEINNKLKVIRSMANTVPKEEELNNKLKVIKPTIKKIQEENKVIKNELTALNEAEKEEENIIKNGLKALNKVQEEQEKIFFIYLTKQAIEKKKAFTEIEKENQKLRDILKAARKRVKKIDSCPESDYSDDTYSDSKTLTEIEEINQKLSDVFNTMRTRLEIIDSRRLKQMDSCTKKYYKKYEEINNKLKVIKPTIKKIQEENKVIKNELTALNEAEKEEENIIKNGLKALNKVQEEEKIFFIYLTKRIIEIRKAFTEIEETNQKLRDILKAARKRVKTIDSCLSKQPKTIKTIQRYINSRQSKKLKTH